MADRSVQWLLASSQQFAVLTVLAAGVFRLSPVVADDWPGFRGPTGMAVTQETDFPTSWSKTENIRWRVAMPNRGNESPIVSNGRVFATSASNNGSERRLHCFNRQDGRELWSKSVSIESEEVTHQTNPFGAATPAADGKRVVVWHGSAGLYCYSFEGELLWKADLGKVRHIWGYGSSPVLYEGLVLLNFGPGSEQFVVAVDIETGAVFWKFDITGGDDDRNGRMVGSWSTPVVARVGDSDQIICSLPTRVVGLNPEDGTLIWECAGLSGKNGDLVYTSPLISDGIGVAMGGYTGPAIGFRLGGTGDVTETHRLWQQTEKNPQRIGSGQIIGDRILMANAGPGTIQCLDLKTGEELWANRGAGGNHWGSLCRAGNTLYVTNQDGATIVMAANPEKYEEIAVNRLDEASNSTPAFSDAEIFIRTSKALYCVSKRAGQ